MKKFYKTYYIFHQINKIMEKKEFIKFIFEKGKIDNEVTEQSKNIDNFPLAYKIILSISDSDFINIILNPKEYGQIDLARNDLISHNLIKNSEIKQDAIKFINELTKESKLQFQFKKQSSKSFSNNKKNSAQDIILGIDLGTTNTLAAFIENDQVVTIPLKNGSRLLPSYISVNKKNNFDIGENALRQQLSNPEETFYSIKRFIGRRSSEFSSSLISAYPFNIDQSEEKLGINSKRLQKRFECEELSAQILLTIKANAERFLNQEIKDCVITVPAYFDNNQRVATKKAAQIAGLNVKRLISEPTAAAFAYGISKHNSKSVSLVLDLGGGTFDISLVRSEGEDLESFSVIAHSGERDLGGDDFTNTLVETIIKAIKKDHPKVSISPTIKILIRDKVIEAKHSLSFQDETEILFPMLPSSDNQIVSFSYVLTRKNFEKIVKKHTETLSKCIKNFLELDKVKSNKIQQIVLVGGASRMPLFINLIEKLTSIKPLIDTNPDEIIAQGAAYCAKYTLSGVKEKIIIDVTPLSLGIQTIGDIHSEVIPPNTVLPTRKSRVFTTLEDYQNSVSIKAFQGNRKIASDNIFLNGFVLEDIEIAKGGIPEVDVTFEIDLDGILTVTAKDKKTKSKNSIKITNSLDITETEVKKLRENAILMAEEDVKKTFFSEKYKELFTWKKVFDEISDPSLSDNEQLILDRTENCLDKIHKSGEDPEYLAKMLMKIIQKRNQYSEDNAA